MQAIVAEVELEKAHLVSWLEFKEIKLDLNEELDDKKKNKTKKVIMVGYIDGQVEILCFYSKQTLFRTEPSQEGIVKGIFFTIKG